MNMYDRMRKKLKEESEKREQAWTNFKWLGDKEIVRIMPKPKGQNDIYFEGGRHFGIGGTNQSRLCPKLIYSTLDEEQSCPICEAAEQLLKSDNAAKKEMGRDMKPARRFFFNAIVRAEEDKGVQLLEVPLTVWEQIVACFFISEEDEEIDTDTGPYIELDDGSVIFNFTDIKQGRDFIITRNKSGKRVTYNVQMKPAGRKLGTTTQMKEWLSSIEVLDKTLPDACPSYDELKTLLYGDDEDKEEEVDIDELDGLEAPDVDDLEEEPEDEEETPEEESDDDEEESEDLDEDDFDLDENGEIVIKPKKQTKKTTSKAASNLDSKMRQRLRGKKK